MPIQHCRWLDEDLIRMHLWQSGLQHHWTNTLAPNLLFRNNVSGSHWGHLFDGFAPEKHCHVRSNHSQNYPLAMDTCYIMPHITTPSENPWYLDVVFRFPAWRCPTPETIPWRVTSPWTSPGKFCYRQDSMRRRCYEITESLVKMNHWLNRGTARKEAGVSVAVHVLPTK